MCDDQPTPIELEPNRLLDQPDARRRDDPWAPWSCPKCGHHNQDGMPEVCACGWRTYG